MKYTILVLLIIFSFFIAPPASAFFCRTWDGHQICVLSIKRSAKNYWEYRAVVSVDGVIKPRVVYNCRQQLKVQPDGAILPFEPNDPGKLVCTILK